MHPWKRGASMEIWCIHGVGRSSSRHSIDQLYRMGPGPEDWSPTRGGPDHRHPMSPTAIEDDSRASRLRLQV